MKSIPKVFLGLSQHKAATPNTIMWSLENEAKPMIKCQILSSDHKKQ